MKRILFLAALMLGFTVAAYSQATATGNAAARIISPITLTPGTDLHFGTIYKSVGGGTVQVTPAGIRSVASGTVTLSTMAPIHSAGTFTVGGEPTLTYSITLPADGTVTITSGGNSMNVNGFASTPNGSSTIPGGGSETLSIGATLVVGANQPSGTYTGTYDVTVQYN